MGHGRHSLQGSVQGNMESQPMSPCRRALHGNVWHGQTGLRVDAGHAIACC